MTLLHGVIAVAALAAAVDARSRLSRLPSRQPAARAAAASLPLPTGPQLAWQQGEIMALVHFNMATFFQNGDPGCTTSNWPGPTGSNNPDSFAPSALNISQWADSMLAIKATEAVFVKARARCRNKAPLSFTWHL